MQLHGSGDERERQEFSGLKMACLRECTMMIVAWFWGRKRKHIFTELARNQGADTNGFMIVNLTKTLNIIQSLRTYKLLD